MAKLKSLLAMPEWKALCLRYRYDIGRFASEALGIDYTWQQNELFVSVAQDGSRTSVSSGHGCFAAGTMVMLENGDHIAVEDVTIDHRLMGDDGVSGREVEYLERGEETMFKFTYSDGVEHTFNDSHILCLQHLLSGERREVMVKHFRTYRPVERAMWGAYRLENGEYITYSIAKIENMGLGRYYGFLIDGNHKFLAADGTVFHNTGKTRSAGIVALWHLLFFPESVMMFTAPQIQQLRKLVWKEIEICKSLLMRGRMAWLAEYIVVLAETVYIKGYAKTWHVYAKTAPKGNPQALAGNHGDYLMIWVDEAAAVDAPVFDVLTGALTHDDNRMCLTSQPAKQSGFFYDTHHKLSRTAGGVWNNLIFNSEMTRLVSKSKIREALKQYGSRDDPQYMIRIRGEFPDLAGEFIITQKDAERAYKGVALDKKLHYNFGYFIAVDVGGGVGRDDSTISIIRTWGHTQWGKTARRAELVKVPLCKNNDSISELIGVIMECLDEYPNATLVVDTNGAGAGLGQRLTELGVFFRPVHWGGQCFSNRNRKEFINKRAQAYVSLARAIKSGRFKIRTNRLKSKILEQLTRIPYTFDDQARFKILSKEEMRRKGITSPDIVDTLAFIYLDGMRYTEAYSYAAAVEDPEKYGHGEFPEKDKHEKLSKKTSEASQVKTETMRRAKKASKLLG